jgi:peroxiredoxin
METVTVFSEMMTNRGRSVDEASRERPVMLIFLRHFGCTFCRESLSDLSRKQDQYENEGVQLIFVHMADDEQAREYFQRYALGDPERISDPECRFYSAMGLGKGSFSQLFGLQVMIRGVEAGVLKGHGIGRQIGDGFQMPGVFLVQNGVVREQFIHRLASDRPNYDALLSCCIIP